jgi:AcrR family transcriptional regulator
MAEIGRRAGVSEATLYKYFGNRQELLNRVLSEWATPFIEDLQREIVLVSGLRAKLNLIAIRYLRGMEQTPRLHRVVYQEVRWDDYFGSPLHRLNQRFVKIAVEAIKQGVDDGEATAGTSAVTVRDMLFGGLEHVAHRTVFAGRPLDVDAEAANVVNLLVDGIARRTGGGAVDLHEVSRLTVQLQRTVESLQARSP